MRAIWGEVGKESGRSATPPNQLSTLEKALLGVSLGLSIITAATEQANLKIYLSGATLPILYATAGYLLYGSKIEEELSNNVFCR